MIHVRAGEALLYRGHEEGREILRKATEHPDREVRAEAELALAVEFIYTRERDKALRAFEEVARKFPDMPQAAVALHWVGFYRAEKGDLEGTVEA